MTIPDFTRRSVRPELMDDQDCGFERMQACLAELARVNRLTLALRPTLAFLDRAARQAGSDRPLAVLDVGCGYGDMLRRIEVWARRRALPVSLTGIDRNPHAIRAAAGATPAGSCIRWRAEDVFAYRSSEPVDIVLSAQFTHHLHTDDLLRFLRWMEDTAGLGWFINDLHRHPLPYHAFAVASAAMRLHPFVCHDGPLSIARAFVPADWRQLLAAAGIPSEAAAVERWFPYRLCVARLDRTHRVQE